MSEPKKHRNKKIPLRLIKKKSLSGSIPANNQFSWPASGERLISQTERHNPSAIIPKRSTAQEKIRTLTPTPDNPPDTALPENNNSRIPEPAKQITHEQKSDSTKHLPSPPEPPKQQLPSPQSATAALPPPDNNNGIASAEKKTTSPALTNKLTAPVEIKNASNEIKPNPTTIASLTPPGETAPTPDMNLPVAQENIPDINSLLANKNDFSREAAFMLAEQTLLTEIRRLIDDEPKIVSEILKNWMQDNERNK